MKKIEKSFNKIKKWCLKPFRNLLLAIAILPVAIWALLHLPLVQQQLLRSVVNYLHQATHYHITCDAFRLTWLRHIALEGVTITDPQNKPLLTMHACKGRFNLLSLFLLKPDIIDSVSIVGGQWYVEKNLDQDVNLISLYTNVILPFLPETNRDLYLHKIQLQDINLSYHDHITQQTVKVENIKLAISHFRYVADHYSGNLTTLSCQATSAIPLVLQNLEAQFSITPHNIVLKDCHLITKHSDLQGDVTLRYAKPLGTEKNIALEAILHQTALSSLELSKFSDFFKGSHTLYKLDGVISWTPHATAWKNCALVFGDSYIESTGCYNGIDADLFVQAGRLYMHDLPKKPAGYPPQLQYIGITNARVVANTKKATLAGSFTTDIGAVQTDLIVDHLGTPRQSVKGNVTLHKVTIAAVLPSLPIQSLSGKVMIKVEGNQPHTLDAVAHLTELTINHYSYKQIEASCRLSDAMVTFKLHSKDPNAQLTVAGSYHMAQSLQADGIIEQVRLEKLGFTRTPLSLSTKFSLEIRNIISNRPRGTVRLHQCVLQGMDQKVICKQVVIQAIENGYKDLLLLTSPLIDCSLQGTFTLRDLVHHIRYLVARLNHPAHRLTIPTRLHLDYAINCKKILPILRWFSDDLYISDATNCWGHFSYDRDYHFSFHLPAASTICFKQCRLENIKIKLNVGHLMDTKKRLIRLYIASNHQDWRQIVQTDHLSFRFLMDKNAFTLSNQLFNGHNHLSIACSGTLMDDGIQVDLLPSRLTTKEQVWVIQAESSSLISKSAIAIGNVSITSGQASICLGGQLNQLPTTDPLHCTIRHFPFNYSSSVGPLKAIVDTKLVVHRNKDQLIATGRLRLQEATIQDHVMGTLCTKVDWHLFEHKLSLAGILQKDGKQLLQIDGWYHLLQPTDQLAITTTFNQMDLDLLNPLFASVCSDINGKLSGQFQVTGSLMAPKINGKGVIDQGTFKINYLNTCYQVAGAITIQENALQVDQLTLHDGASGHATLSGHIVIKNGFPLTLSGHMQTFHLLDTTRMHNPDFYGDLYATGTIQMEGSIYDLLLKMKVTADQGTFTIVAHDKEDMENTTKLVEIVYNKPKDQSDQLATTNEDRSAIKFILDLTILPTIKAQVLFGGYNHISDSLQGQGSGAIHLEVGTNRKPYMMGNYLFQSGTYTVSVYNLIQKTFTITPNSQVNFNGYPQEGIAHIGASYKQVVSVAELYPQSNDKRPLPVEILLSAYGTLAHPHIAYQLFFPVKSMDFELNTALEECAAKALLDKTYLNKQILSLLIAKRVYNEKKIDGWDALSNSINDFLSQSIQNLIAKIDHNLEIETDLGMNQSGHQSIWKKTSIKVSYLLLSEHLKLSSTVGRNSRFINDWEISYRISKAHRMHVKLYQQPLSSARADLTLFGVSFAYTKQFG
ncbi:MAG: translocation/assembly module TamB domain-containing protein [Candidatus Cardinium sp.]|uniref:translocation/assembly module TamB domain-containing protein n=1 Tax=Candidatus Cardinium sp. TP TaxID=2961955 RepID=UPI0021AF04A6|nr:translocation/assembly module TamB domain-containing protein [Candidatus Cardinium sp. TP]MCT4696885.1 translocation/assembly module TamB domain-containing protein [Candidatus Cardinium sp. TP]